MKKVQKSILLILDGWGIGNRTKSDAIFNADTPFTDSLYSKYPNSTLTTFGNAVGLPEGQMGNSEVGHLNIGAGRVVWQQLALIDKAFADKTASNNQTLNSTFDYCINHNKTLHLMGLLSDGGVHSSMQHLFSLLDLAAEKGVKNIAIHAFLDGRDTDPKSGLGYIHSLLQHIDTISGCNARLAGVVGRYYAMDRDKRWERVQKAYDLLVRAKGNKSNNIEKTISDYYHSGITDEFMEPVSLTDDTIQENDAVICFNFRTDRGRQITRTLTQEDFPEFGMHKMPLWYVTLTEYDATFQNVKVVFETENVANTLGEVIANNGLKQLRAAETEKYPHVTFFFSGGREAPFDGEERIMIPSPKVATYDLQPEMSALALKDAVIDCIAKGDKDFMCVNFANPDMVGHTGVYSAIVKAVETVDACVAEIVAAALQNNYSLLILADHGNADYALNDDGTPNTAHSMNPVPCWLINPNNPNTIMHGGVLADVAPTILKMMQIDQPKEMTGNALY